MESKVLDKEVSKLNGSLVKNKTYTYLVPFLSYYGELFKTKFSQIPIKAFGIFDENLEGVSGIKDRRPVFILYRSFTKTAQTKSIINWVKNQDYYITDYSYSKRYNMLVISYPHEMSDAYNKFLKGFYSFMHTKDELNKFIDKDKHKKAYGVFYKTAEARLLHVKEANKEFNATISVKDTFKKGYHLDLPFVKEQEIFNHKK